MKGDRVEIVIDAGGSTRTYDIEATRAAYGINNVQIRDYSAATTATATSSAGVG